MPAIVETSVRTSRHLIPHPIDANCKIVGILEQLAPDEPTQGREIALILHGSMGHKDYIFQRQLARRLPLDSFRFDFRGNHETPGTWKFANMGDDVVDLQTVVQYLSTVLGYKTALIVGHSRGSLAAFRWLCTTEEGQRVKAFVNVAARYSMKRIHEWRTLADFKQGFYDWKVTVAGKSKSLKIYIEDLEEFAEWDTSLVWDQFPAAVHVLTIHGLADMIVAPADAVIYSRALGGRTPGTHNLHLVDGADHNFTGRRDDVVNTVLGWWDSLTRGRLKNGIWGTGVRGKL